MKRIFLVMTIFALFLNANEENSKFKIDDLIILPAIGKIIKENGKELAITKEQNERISKEVKQVYPPKFQDLIRQAYTIEKKVQRKVLKSATPSELKEDLDEIARLKRESINLKIEAVNEFQKILTKEQWEKIIELSK
ncbi:hypothetical protein ACOL3G_01075 [Aliarcobacter butzleri]|uniref:hypothetical protein n=1 Tax=Aliarcobacter butzleri TaxID=28197 RepID=UPI00126A2675|nr:hypothetical protein [Aliarcobacter butzleri]